MAGARHIGVPRDSPCDEDRQLVAQAVQAEFADIKPVMPEAVR